MPLAIFIVCGYRLAYARWYVTLALPCPQSAETVFLVWAGFMPVGAKLPGGSRQNCDFGQHVHETA